MGSHQRDLMDAAGDQGFKLIGKNLVGLGCSQAQQQQWCGK